MPLAFSTPEQIASVVGLIAVAMLLRVFGRWLMSKGGEMERGRHGQLPGGYMDPAKRRPGDEGAAASAERSPERAEPARPPAVGRPAAPPDESAPASGAEPYDPFNAG
jgi:hypothetical protein